MPGRPAPSSPRTIAVALVLALAATGTTACGTDGRTAYADGWDDVCRELGGALATFRTAVSSAATDSPDAGDLRVAAGPPPRAVAGDVLVAARQLRTAVAEQAAAASELEPPRAWSSWHPGALRDLAVRRRAVDEGVRRLTRGDADALPLLAIGSFGPASVRAPAGLRDRAPECTSLR